MAVSAAGAVAAVSVDGVDVSAAGPATSPIAVTAGDESDEDADDVASDGDEAEDDSCEDGELDPIELLVELP